MQAKKVIILVGMPGAGKSFCVEHLEQKGLPSVYFGGIVVDETIKRYGKTDAEHEQIVREDLRAKEGKGAIAQRILKKIDDLFAQDQHMVVADGLYSWTEYKLFKERFGDNAVIIAIAAPRRTRHERLANRPIRPLTDEEVSKREYAEIENIEKGGPIANADYTLVNDTDQASLLAALDKVLAENGLAK